MSTEVQEKLVEEVVALRRRVAHLETLENPSLPATIDADTLDGMQSTSSPTANTVMARDTSGRAQVVAPSAAADIARLDTIYHYGRYVCGGRLTLASGTPVTTSDVTAATVLYFTPYWHSEVALYTNGAWQSYTFSERSLSLSSLSADTNYDIFLYDNAGTLTLQAVAWSNNTTRATDLARQDGVYVKSGAPEYRYLGTIRTTGTAGQCEDSVARRFVWNCYNRVLCQMVAVDTTDSWTYTVQAWRPSHNNTTDGVGRVSFVVGIAGAPVTAWASVHAGHDAGALTASCGIACDATNTNHAQVHTGRAVATGHGAHYAFYSTRVGAGYHYLQWVEYSSYTSGTSTFHGDNGLANLQSGMVATVEA